MNILSERHALLAAATALLVMLATDPALASAADNLFGGQNPLQNLVEFTTGPFAFAIVILGVVGAGAGLVFGGDFSGWSRRLLLLAAAGAVVMLASSVVTALFGGGTGFSVPPDMLLQAWPWPDGAEAGA